MIEVELTKKNCLMLIVVNLNMHKTTKEVEHGIKELLGDKNVINLYFPKRYDNVHRGIVNMSINSPPHTSSTSSK